MWLARLGTRYEASWVPRRWLKKEDLGGESVQPVLILANDRF